MAQCLILGLDFYHKVRIGTDCDKDRKLYLHRDGKLVISARPSNSVSNIQPIKYQEILPYTTAIIQMKFENSIQLETENNYMIKAQSAFIDNNPNLKCYPIPINKATVHNYVFPLIITNNSDNKTLHS